VSAVHDHHGLGTPQPSGGRGGPASGRIRSTLGSYVSLMKLRVVETLLVTTVPAMVLAARGVPPLGLLAATLVGGTLAAGSAHAFNQVIERDIDAMMRRTRKRPVATSTVSPRAGLVFAAVLLAVSVAIMLLWVNPVAAALTLLANVVYVVLYTILLKRRTAQNIVWGGIAGCLPTLIGWAAVTGGLDWPPVLLFLIVFFWTPPHYWPLAMRYRDDYARAGVPMLPVVAAAPSVARQILLYSGAMVATALLLWPVGALGWIYAVISVLAGTWFLWETVRLYRRTVTSGPDTGPEQLRTMRVFHGSITYLTLVFAAVAVDVLILG